jgi:type IX secretion system PorP/SprF family membrane protein
MKKTGLLFFVLLTTLNLDVRSQDLHLAQIQEAPLVYNPANTGFFAGYYRIIGGYRNQWASMGKAYQTMGLSVDGGIFRNRYKNAFLGIGFNVFSDKAGAANLSQTLANFNIAAILKASKKTIISAGLYGGITSNTGNYAKLTYATQFNGVEIDPSLASQESVVYHNFTSSDFGAGLAYEFSDITTHNDRDDIVSIRVGVAAYHLNKPLMDYGTSSYTTNPGGVVFTKEPYHMPVRYVGSLTSRIDIKNTKLSLTPTAIYMIQGTATELTAGTYFKYRFKNGTKITGEKVENSLGIGLFYRMNDAIIPQVLIDMGTYAIGISYDMNISSYRKASRTVGGFEISLRYNKLADALFNKRREYSKNNKTRR